MCTIPAFFPSTTVSTLTNHKSYSEHILDLKLFFFSASIALSVSKQVIYPASNICFPPTTQLILIGREYRSFLRLLQFLSNLFCSFTAFLHTYSISLQGEGRSRLSETPTALNSIRPMRGQLTFRWIERPRFKVVTHFKLMFQITTRGSSIWMSFKLATAMFAYCSSNL